MAKKKVTTTSTAATVETKETVKAELEKLVAKWNESAEFSEFKVMQALESKISEAVSKYAEMCEGECFVELKKAENPMLAAAMKLGFETLTVKDEKEKDANGKSTGKTRKVLSPTTKRIDPLRLHKTVKDGIGADSKWVAMVETLNTLFTAAAAVDINAVNTSGEKLDLQKIRDTHAMSDAAKKLLSEKGDNDPNNDEIMLKDVQDTVNAMLGEGYTADLTMVKYLRKVHEKGGRSSMTVVCSNARSMRQYMLDVCHAAITGDSFILDYKKAKK